MQLATVVLALKQQECICSDYFQVCSSSEQDGVCGINFRIRLHKVYLAEFQMDNDKNRKYCQTCLYNCGVLQDQIKNSVEKGYLISRNWAFCTHDAVD